MTIELNREAVEALDRDALEQMTYAAQELVFAQQHGHDEDEYERTILACAEVHGALTWAKAPGDRGTVTVEFSKRAQAWLAQAREQVAEHVADLDAGINEPDQERVAQVTYLLHLLDRIVGQPAVAA